MTHSRPDQRGVIAGLLKLSRNFGLVAGASLMGAVFARGAASTDVMTAGPAAIAARMRGRFAVAAALVVIALALANGSRLVALRAVHAGHKGGQDSGAE